MLKQIHTRIFTFPPNCLFPQDLSTLKKSTCQKTNLRFSSSFPLLLCIVKLERETVSSLRSSAQRKFVYNEDEEEGEDDEEYGYNEKIAMLEGIVNLQEMKFFLLKQWLMKMK